MAEIANTSHEGLYLQASNLTSQGYETAIPGNCVVGFNLGRV
jgi:hypothetical protein